MAYFNSTHIKFAYVFVGIYKFPFKVFSKIHFMSIKMQKKQFLVTSAPSIFMGTNDRVRPGTK